MISLFTMFLTITITACGNSKSATSEKKDTTTPTEAVTKELTKEPTKEPTKTPTKKENVSQSFSIDVTGITTTDELEKQIEQDLNEHIESLKSQWELLSKEIDSNKKYVSKSTEVTELYDTIIDETKQMCIRLREYSAVYARMVLEADMSNENRYDAIQGIDDYLYDEACKEINDEIYEGLLDDMELYLIGGILANASFEADYEYEKHKRIFDKELNQWKHARFEVSNLYEKTASDINSFYSNISGKLNREDTERANRVYAMFLDKIGMIKSSDLPNSISENVVFDTTIKSITSTEEFDTIVMNQVFECILALNNEWISLSNDINTYDKYSKDSDKVEDLYNHLADASESILVMIQKYGISYAKLVLESKSSSEDKYNDIEDFSYCIYEDACGMVEDKIYNCILGQMKDYYYNGMLKNAKNDEDFDDWSVVYNNDSRRWSKAYNKVGAKVLLARSDIKNYYKRLRDALAGNDINEANKALQDFIRDVEK